MAMLLAESSAIASQHDAESRAIEEIARRGGVVVDAGGGTRFTKGLAQHAHRFATASYKTLDNDPATGPGHRWRHSPTAVRGWVGRRVPVPLGARARP
jgi:hypothetical protein